MKITAKLAYSQLKINRSRTFWAVMAITLSTAMITTVCGLVASGNAMLVELLGPDYGNYAGTYQGLLLVPAVLFGIIIVSMSVIVISNVFRVSADERITQFGILQCVGATGKQIMETIMYESVFFSMMGIPAGILAGLGLTAAGICVVNANLAGLNALTDMMLVEIQFHLEFVWSFGALAVAAAISFITVIYSAWRPAHRAKNASAAENVRGNGIVKKEDLQWKIGTKREGLVKKAFGFEGVLAYKNIRRNRRNFKATVTALAAGAILFISLCSINTQASKLEQCMTLDLDETVISDFVSDSDRTVNEETGRRESYFPHLVDAETGNRVTEMLEQFDGKSVFGMGADLETWYCTIPGEALTEEMVKAMELPAGEDQEFGVDVIILDQENYGLLCEKAGVEPGSVILLNNYRYNDNGFERDIVPYANDMKELEVFKADGTGETVTIDAALTIEDTPKELFYFNMNPVRLVVPEASVPQYSWYSAPEDEEGFIAYSDEVLAEVFPEAEDSTYMEAGFSTRTYRTDDYVKIMNIAITLVLVFAYSFVALLMLIGFTNVISTMTTNVLMRKREFAVLQSIGMTPEGLRKMLNFESVLCSLKALVIGVPVGVILTYLINRPIRAMFPVPYELPVLSVLLCVAAVLGITCGITGLAQRKLKKQNIIEAIRMESD